MDAGDLLFGKQEHGLFPCPPQFIDQFPTVDHYLAHNTFSNPKTKEQFILMVTDRNLYKFTPTVKRLWMVDLRDIHSVEEGAVHEELQLWLRARKGSALESFKRISKEELYSEYLWAEVCHTDNIMTRDLWLMMFHRILRITNQKFFESLFIPAPEVYQWSFYLNKINEQGKLQVRLLVASSNRLFNVEVKPGTLEIVRPVWAFAVGAVECVMTFTDNTNLFTLKIAAGTPSGLGRSKPMRELVSYVTRDHHERNSIVTDLKRLYRNNTQNKQLRAIEQKDSSKMTKGSWIETAQLFFKRGV